MSSIVYNYFDFGTNKMEKNTLNLETLIMYIPKDQGTRIITNIKLHCNEEDEFVIFLKNGKIINPEIFDKINKYIEKNNSRSYFFEGLISSGNGKYYLAWGS
jgi:hypothetical protein